MEGSLRTPALVRYPGHVPAGQVSDEIVHITDMFTTLIDFCGPVDRLQNHLGIPVRIGKKGDKKCQRKRKAIPADEP
jgi:arylsulfatase A-like enzyme